MEGAILSIFDILFCRTEKKLVEKTVHQQDSLNYAEYELRRLKTEFSNAQNIASDVQAKIVPVLRKMMTNGVSVKDYKRLYEVRMYNLQSRQNDIRVLKLLDSEGVYVFHNITEGTYCIGKATYLFRKIKRIIDGYDNPAILEKMENGCRFVIYAVRLINTDYESIDDLLKVYEINFQSKNIMT